MTSPKVYLSVSVLIVTEDDDFAQALADHLDGSKFQSLRLLRENACQPHRLREIHCDVALVDHEVTTEEGLPLFQLIRNMLPDCEVILITTPKRATEAARLARLWEVFDYVLPDCVNDENRIPLLIERATTRCLPNLSELRGQAKMERRRVLEMLSELRKILKSRVEGPVVEMLHHYKMAMNPFASQQDLPERLATETYQHSVVDLICGRLKRLETLVELSEEGDPPAATGSPSNQVLVVDDEPVSLELARFVLEKNGFNVVGAESAATARRLMESCDPALILMDVHLGDANGLHLVRTLREHSACRDVPVIVVTADSVQETVREAISVDVQGFVCKPYDSAILVDKVKNALADVNARRLTASGVT